MNGFILVHKPAGMTSHDVVYKIKKKLNLSKVGHTGTLDPFATGLMIILTGQATKLAFLFENLDKAYTGQMTFGALYDTDDYTGNIVDQLNVNYTQEELIEALKTFQPGYEQMPPLYSAIKKNGIKAYQAARQGISLALEKRQVKIYDIKLIDNGVEPIFYAHVSKGTYIRSIARDLGEKLGTYGALKALERVQIGPYHLKDAVHLESVSEDNITPDINLFDGVKQVKLNDYMIKLVLNGVYLDERQTNLQEPFIVINEHGEYIAYYEPFENQYKPKYIFVRNTK